MCKVSQGRACGAPCCGCDLAGMLPPALRIHAGSSFSLTAKPACFLASAACMTPQRTWSRGQVGHDWYGMFQVEPCTERSCRNFGHPADHNTTPWAWKPRESLLKRILGTAETGKFLALEECCSLSASGSVQVLVLSLAVQGLQSWPLAWE